MILDIAKLLVLPTLLIAAAVSDLFTMTIPNRIALLMTAGFVAVAAADGMSLQLMASHFGAGALVLAGAFICFTRGWIGGGDAKFAAVTALWFGFGDLMNYMLNAAILGGALTLAIVAFRSWPLPFAAHMPDWAHRLHHRDSGVPYGIALAAAALALYPETTWMRTVDLARFSIG